MADTLYRCTFCDKKVEASGRYGHVKFSDGDGHGPKGEVPADTEDCFVEADSPLETDGDDSKEGEDSPNKTESEGESTDPENEGNQDESSTESSGESSTQTTGGSGNRETGEQTEDTTNPIAALKEWLTTPLAEH